MHPSPYLHNLGYPRLSAARCKHQAGVALITVLLIVFLASVAATSLAAVQHLTIRRSTLLLHQEQARLYTLGAEQWAMAILKRDRQKTNVDSFSEDWAKLPPSLPIEGGSLSGRIQDLQGRFNLNNLLKTNLASPLGNQNDDSNNPQETSDALENATGSNRTGQSALQSGPGMIDQDQLKILQRLLEILELNPAIAQAIADWIDPDQEVLFPDGAEDGEYTVRDPPYLAANRLLTSVSELRLIKGIDKEAYDKLAPYVCALPPGIPLNVNTLAAPLMMALSDNIDSMRAEALVEDLKKQSFTAMDEFTRALGLGPDQALQGKLAVASQFFLVQSEAQVGDGHATLYSVLKRGEDGTARVLKRSFGSDY